MSNGSGKSQFNSGTILVAFFAILVGLAGTYAVRMAIKKPEITVPEDPKPPRPEMVTVPLASRDIESGTQITLDDIALYRMTREEIKESIRATSFMTNPEQIIGKILLNDLKRGKTFDTRDFFPTGKSPGVAKRLKPGLRAMTIVLDPTDALNGFAGPGQRVDVMFHYGVANDEITKSGGGFYPQHFDFNPPRRRDYDGHTIGSYDSGDIEHELQHATATLIQDSEILALGKQSTPTDAASGIPPDEKVSVTLAVNPREAELLRVAEGHGKLSLTLRGPADDHQYSLLDPITLSQIINLDDRHHKMEIYRGTAMSQLSFASGKTIRKKVFSDEPPVVARPRADADSQVPSAPVGYWGPAGQTSLFPVWLPYQSPLPPANPAPSANATRPQNSKANPPAEIPPLFSAPSNLPGADR